jgi:hypothetical protein
LELTGSICFDNPDIPVAQTLRDIAVGRIGISCGNISPIRAGVYGINFFILATAHRVLPLHDGLCRYKALDAKHPEKNQVFHVDIVLMFDLAQTDKKTPWLVNKAGAHELIS